MYDTPYEYNVLYYVWIECYEISQVELFITWNVISVQLCLICCLIYNALFNIYAMRHCASWWICWLNKFTSWQFHCEELCIFYLSYGWKKVNCALLIYLNATILWTSVLNEYAISNIFIVSIFVVALIVFLRINLLSFLWCLSCVRFL